MAAPEDFEHNLTNHAPSSDGVVARFEAIRVAGKALAAAIVEQCPSSRERSLALTNLEQATMWAIGSIARNQEV